MLSILALTALLCASRIDPTLRLRDVDSPHDICCVASRSFTRGCRVEILNQLSTSKVTNSYSVLGFTVIHISTKLRQFCSYAWRLDVGENNTLHSTAGTQVTSPACRQIQMKGIVTTQHTTDDCWRAYEQLLLAWEQERTYDRARITTPPAK